MSEQESLFSAELVQETLELLGDTENYKKGANEVTKAITRTARQDSRYDPVKLVIIAEDVDPPEVTYHMTGQAKAANVPYVLVPSQDELGATIGIKRTSAVAVFDESAFSKVIANAAEIVGL